MASQQPLLPADGGAPNPGQPISPGPAPGQGYGQMDGQGYGQMGGQPSYAPPQMQGQQNYAPPQMQGQQPGYVPPQMQGQGYGQMPVPGYAPMMQGQGYGQMPGQPMYGGPQMAGPGYGQMGGPGYGQMGGPAPQPVPVAGPPPYSAPPQGPPYQADNNNVGQQIVSKAPTHFQQVDNKIVAHAGVNQAPCHYDGVLTPVFCSRSDCKRWICAKHQKADLVWRTVNHKRCGQAENSGCPCPALPNWRQTTGAPVCADETQLIHDLNSPRPPMPGENKCHFCNMLTPVTCTKTECKKYICPSHLQHDVKWVEGAPTRSCGFGQHSACWCSKSVDVNLAISTPVCAEHVVDRTKPTAYPKQKLNWAAIICTMIFVFFMIGSVLGGNSSSRNNP